MKLLHSLDILLRVTRSFSIGIVQTLRLCEITISCVRFVLLGGGKSTYFAAGFFVDRSFAMTLAMRVLSIL
jgi:hypothetical protein